MSATIVQYIMESAAWALLGFLGGFVLGRAARDFHRVADAASGTGDAMPDPERAARRRWRPTYEWTIGIVVLLLTILTVVQGIAQSTETRRLVVCLQDYSNAFADALDARTSASNAAQSALDKLMTAVGHTFTEPPSTQRAAEVQRAITTYLTTRAALVREQQQHPYPPAPRDVCH